MSEYSENAYKEYLDSGGPLMKDRVKKLFDEMENDNKDENID